MPDPARFVAENTALLSPPLVPEIRLHLATEVVPLWRKTEEELEAEGVPPPYWAFAWAGGQALARYVLDHPAEVADKRVLDFGSGSGLVAIAAAKAGASGILAADIDAFACAAIVLNATANAVAIKVTRDDVIGATCAWETILVGDMCYEQPLADRLTSWLRALAGDGVTVLLGDPGRSYVPTSGLTALARYTVPTSRELEDRESREGIVWRVEALPGQRSG
jgi:predicted nicotinamide N-methyase